MAPFRKMDEALKHVFFANCSENDFLFWVKFGMSVKCAHHVHSVSDFRNKNEKVVRLWHFSQHFRSSNCVCCPRCDLLRSCVIPPCDGFHPAYVHSPALRRHYHWQNSNELIGTRPQSPAGILYVPTDQLMLYSHMVAS